MRHLHLPERVHKAVPTAEGLRWIVVDLMRNCNNDHLDLFGGLVSTSTKELAVERTVLQTALKSPHSRQKGRGLRCRVRLHSGRLDFAGI